MNRFLHDTSACYLQDHISIVLVSTTQLLINQLLDHHAQGTLPSHCTPLLQRTFLSLVRVV